MSAKAPALSASRILNATRVAQAADDTGVTGWLKTAQFIVAAQLDEQTGPWNSKVYKCQWRQSGGTFADLAATGEMAWGATTDLVNGNAVASGEEACTNDPGGTLVDGWEVEGALAASALSLADEDYAEIQWAIDPAGANFSQAYEFQVYDVTTGAAVGTCLATVTTEAAPAIAINQISFRVRSGDLGITLNAATGWAAAQSVDASIDMGTRFRIRFEIEETLGATFNSAVKLQYNKNLGGWVDAVAYPDTSPTSVPVIWCRESDEYLDLDATTNLLTGSTETFAPGDGNNDPAAAAVTLSNQHTEHEFVIEIPTWYDGPNRNIATDYFDFRLVESDGTVFTGTYDNPRITLTERAGHIGATGMESPGHMGPICDGNGNLYWACENSEVDAIVMMLKSTDGGDKWLEMDGANRPTSTDFESGAMVYDGNVIHLMWEDGSVATYHQFNTSSNGTTPDTWVITDEVIATGYTNADQSGSIEVRSDGTVVAFYRRTATGESLFYKIRSTVPGWGSEIEVDDTASVDFLGVMTVMNTVNDLIHIFYRDDTNNDIFHKSLNSSNTLSARESVYTNTTTSTNHWSMTNAVYWNNGSVDKVMIAVLDNTDEYIYSVVIEADGTPGTPKEIDAVAINDDPTPYNSRQPVAFLAVDPATDIVYCYYCDLATFDIWRVTSADDATWSAPTEVHDAVTCEVIRGNVFTHNAGNGSATVVGYVWENGSDGNTGYQEYNEYEVPDAGENIALATASITAGGQAMTIIPGAVSKALDTASVIAGGQALSVVPGTATIALATALANANGQALTIVPGLVSIPLATALATAAGQIITVSIGGGPISIPLDTASIIAGGQILTVVPGSVSKALNTALLTANGQAISIVPGSISKALNTAALIASGQALTIIPGSVSTSLNTALLTANGQIITISLDGAPINITLDTALINTNGQVVAIIPGSVSTALNTAAMTAGGQATSIIPGAASTILATAAISAIGQAIAIVPGAVNITLTTATTTANGQQVTITLGYNIALDTATITANGQVIAIVPGAVSTALQTASVVAGGVPVTIVPGAISVGLDTATLSTGGQSIQVLPGVFVVSLDTAQIQADGQQIGIIPGATSVLLSTAALIADGQGISVAALAEIIAIVKEWTLRTRGAGLTLEERLITWSLKDDDR